MKHVLSLLTFLSCCVAAAIPFTGPGVNTHGQLLPVADLKAIGVRWIRADVPTDELSEYRVREVLNHYGKDFPVLWMLSQRTPNAPAVARRLKAWGVKDIEVTNEVDEAVFNVEARPWTGTEYGRWFKSVRQAVGAKFRLYGPVLSRFNRGFVRDAMRAGMTTTAIDVHGYDNMKDLAGFVDGLQKEYGLGVIVSEVGPLDRNADPSIWYLAWKMAMHDRPWCWYDGPQTDWRGLFAQTSGIRWMNRTSVYETILKATLQ